MNTLKNFDIVAFAEKHSKNEALMEYVLTKAEKFGEIPEWDRVILQANKINKFAERINAVLN